jgi:tripartite-type tricarboxylate transporter receptor subunit TctC
MRADISRRGFLRVTVMAGAALAGFRARADSYPTKPIRFLIGGAAGSGPDVIARLLGDRLSAVLRQPLVIENRPGAAGTIAMQALTGSAPDGYTIALVTMSQAVFNSYLFSKLPYDPLRDLEPVSLTVTGAMAIAAHPALAASTFAEFVSFAKAQPGKILFGIPQLGSPPHVIAELVMRATSTQVIFVPFKSGPDAVAGVLRGDVSVAIDAPLIFVPHLKEHALKILAVTGRSREDELPDVPTVVESGFPAAEGEAWIGVVAPAHTPRDIVIRLNQAIATVLAQRELRERLAALSFRPVTGTPEEFRTLIGADQARWGTLIREAGIRLD